MRYESYRWVVTKDHIPFEDGSTNKGVMGPRDCDENLKSNPGRWSAYDDDMNCYYEGMIYGEYDGIEPLYDFAMPDAGAVHIKLNGEWV